MRYYDISVLDSAGAVAKHWTSHPNGLLQPPDPGALKIEIDAFNAAQGPTPLPGSYVRVWGITLDDIGRASDLTNHTLILRGGMGRGLPLANPSQAGVLVQGTIQQAFANWVGTTMTLDMILVAGSTSAGSGAAQNFVLHWPAGTKLSDALLPLMQTLFPGFKININISDSLVNGYDELHFCATWGQLAEYVLNQSRRIIGTGPALSAQWNTPVNALSTYPGVQIQLSGSTINIFDGTVAAAPKSIVIYDLVGQPTWVGPQQVQITCVMRGDIQVGDFITLPPTRAIVTPASIPQYSTQRQSPIFQGTFLVNKLHHVGNYKDPDALSWVTAIDATIQVRTDAQGQASLQTTSGPAPQVIAGGPGASSTSTTSTATGSSSGLVGGTAPSLNTPITAEPLPPPTPQTADDVGLQQSLPAPSQGQSVQH